MTIYCTMNNDHGLMMMPSGAQLESGSPEGPNWDLGGGDRPQVRLLLTFSHLHVVVNIVTRTGQRVFVFETKKGAASPLSNNFD